MRLVSLVLLACSVCAFAQTKPPHVKLVPPLFAQEVQPDVPMNPVDDSSLDDAKNEVHNAVPQLRHMLNQLEELEAKSGACAEQVPSPLRSRFSEQMPALKKLLVDMEPALRQVERDPLNPDSLAHATLLVDSARVVTLRWAALLPRCKAFQGFAAEQVTLPLDTTDPVIVMRHALGQLAGTRDKQVKQLRLMLETAGSRVEN